MQIGIFEGRKRKRHRTKLSHREGDLPMITKFNLKQVTMKQSEVIALLKKHGYKKLTVEEALDDGRCAESKTYFKNNGNLCINTGRMGFNLLAKKNDLGMGIYEYSDENKDMHYTTKDIFFSMLEKEVTTSETAKRQASLFEQWEAMKEKHPDAIIILRVGDFYETFGQDAIDVSKILGITLTKRLKDKTGKTTMGNTELTGFPHFSLDAYLPKLVRAGRRVALCEELKKK